MNDTITITDATWADEKSFKTSEATRRRERRKNEKRAQIAIPRRLKDRIDILRDQFQESYEAGRIELPAGVDPERLPISYVIEKALDELEGHRERSKKSRSNRKTAKE